MKRVFALASLLFFLSLSESYGNTIITLSDKGVHYVINVDVGSPQFGHLINEVNGEASSNPLFWFASWTSNISTSPISTDASCANGCEKSFSFNNDENSLNLVWDQIPLQDDAPNVLVSLHVSATGGALNIVPTFQVITSVDDKQTIGLWQWGFNIDYNFADEGDSIAVFEPSGFGAIHQGEETAVDYQGDYPSSSACMQFMAAYKQSTTSSFSNKPTPNIKHGSGEPPLNYHGIYFATHDAAGTMKTLSVAKTPQSNQVKFGVYLTPPNAGVQMKDATATYTPDFSIVFSTFQGDWFDAASIYRSWVLPASLWTQTKVQTPAWFHQVTTWVNSHWQGNDIFNTTGGDPNVLLPRMQAIVERFGLQPNQLAVHWYEWDLLGYDVDTDEYYGPCPADIVNCGFDTNYPNYAGVRTNFNSSLKQIQELGVYVFPYINGRIYDQSTQNWNPTGKSGAAKSLHSVTTLTDTSEAVVTENGLDCYNESYGSEALFAVMCPHDAEFQSTISETVSMIVNDLNCDGAYIDQIGAAGPKACFDPTHNHSLGGGEFWVEGYRQMLDQVRAVSTDKVILTESNAEPYMGGIDVYLALTAFTNPNYAISSSYRFVPAFAAIYGGYYTACGAEFFQSDLTDGSDVFAAKLTAQFLAGAQMGWMSLGGRDNQVPPMGLYDLLMDSDYDDAALFIKTLGTARAALGELFYQGRASRDLNFTTSSSSMKRHASTANRGLSAFNKKETLIGLEYDVISTQVWLDDTDSTQLIILAVSNSKEQEGDIVVNVQDMNVADYGFITTSSSIGAYAIDMTDGSETYLATYAPTSVSIQLSVAARGVTGIKLKEL